MPQNTSVKTKNNPSEKLMNAILNELRLLRREVALLLPEEELDDFAHPARIRRSYERAFKKYPPSAVWK